MSVVANRSFVASLRSGIVWTLGSTVISAACQWMVVVALARYGTASQLGQYSLALAVYGPIGMFSRLNMRTVMVTDSAWSFESQTYISARIVLTMMAAAAVLLYGMVTFGTANLVVLVGVVLLKSVESISDIVEGLLQREGKFDVIGNATIARGILLIVVLLIGILSGFQRGFEWSLFVVSVVWVAILSMYELLHSGISVGKLFCIRNPGILRLSRQCFPTGAVMMLASLNLNVPVYFLSHFYGVEQVGHYSSVAYFTAVGGLLAAAVTQSSAGPLAIYYQNDRRRYWSSLREMLSISLVLMIFGIVISIIFGKQILGFVYGRGFAQFDDILTWVAVATGLSIPAAFLGLALTVARQFWSELFLTLISVGLVALVAFWLVPLRGMVGAAMALSAGIAGRAFFSVCILRAKVTVPERS